TSIRYWTSARTRARVPMPTRETPNSLEAPGLQGGRTPGVAFIASKKWKIANPKVIIAAAVRTQASRVLSSARRVWIQGKVAAGLLGAATGVLLATVPDPSPFTLTARRTAPQRRQGYPVGFLTFSSAFLRCSCASRVSLYET